MVTAIVLCGTVILLFHNNVQAKILGKLVCGPRVINHCIMCIINMSLTVQRRKVAFQLDPNGMTTSSSSRIMYEEIADPPSAINCTQCPARETTTEVVKHNYEEVKLHGNLDIPTTHDSQHVLLMESQSSQRPQVNTYNKQMAIP